MKEELFEELYDKMNQKYFKACREFIDLRIQLERVEEERNRLVNTLKEIIAVPVAKSMHNEELILHNIAHRALEDINNNDKEN